MANTISPQRHPTNQNPPYQLSQLTKKPRSPLSPHASDPVSLHSPPPQPFLVSLSLSLSLPLSLSPHTSLPFSATPHRRHHHPPTHPHTHPQFMATASFQPLHKHFLHHPYHNPNPHHRSFLKTIIPHKPLTTLIASSTLTPTTPTTSSSFDALAHHLSTADFRQADEETRRLLIDLAGDTAIKRGYVFFSEVQFISIADFRTIDRLWRLHSGDRFGYSVQRRLWDKSGRDFTRFFLKIGWMKLVESSEMEQYNYCAFPKEFVWEIREDGTTPEGHLPLTNALRGTQLMAAILTHPAFDDGGEKGSDGDDEGSEGGEMKPKSVVSSNMRSLKSDYSF